MSEHKQAQAIYISHGGGPLPLLHDPSHEKMITFMKQLPRRLRRPEAIIVISAHWEEDVVTVQSGETPAMYYDYYGFPKETYEVRYLAKGDPSLAKKVSSILAEAGIPNASDSGRGFDHGLFIPLMLMYPEADIPCFQISLLHNLDSAAHLALGKALRPLLQENILLIGSGFSFHNLSSFTMQEEQDDKNDAFQEWLKEACASSYSETEREQALLHWNKAPYASYCHPRVEHLLPLHVCAGFANDNAEVIFDDYIAGKRSLAFLW
ncbi:MAG: hypothetical protein PWP24_1121 [Clostridiales bacterium]|nr:hypothetical protein [Clostridiales bacterium]